MSRHATIQTLLKAGARTNVRSIYGVTPMTLAILCDDPYSVKLLIEHGYAITHSYPWNEYPFEQAIKIHAEGSAMMIAHLGCELKIKAGGNYPLNPLTVAANEGLINLMYLLINMQPQWINQLWIRKRQYPNALYRLRDVQNDLQRMFKNPFRLKQLCRAKISQTIGKFYTEKINDFKKLHYLVSDQLLDYLRYNDVLNPVKHFRPIGKHLNHFEVNGIEFYWDQRILRYRKRYNDDDHYDITKDKHRDEQPRSAIVRVKSTLLKRQEHQQKRKTMNDTPRQIIPNNSNVIVTKHVRINIQSAHNTGRGILPKLLK